MPVIRYDVGDRGRMVFKPNYTIMATENDSAAQPVTTETDDGRRSGDVCLCRRKLRVMELCGRWDDRVRIG